MTKSRDPKSAAMGRHPPGAAWDVVSVVHSRSGVELRLFPALHVWDFPAHGQRFAHGRDENDALSRFARQLANEHNQGGAACE